MKVLFGMSLSVVLIGFGFVGGWSSKDAVNKVGDRVNKAAAPVSWILDLGR